MYSYKLDMKNILFMFETCMLLTMKFLLNSHKSEKEVLDSTAMKI